MSGEHTPRDTRWKDPQGKFGNHTPSRWQEGGGAPNAGRGWNDGRGRGDHARPPPPGVGACVVLCFHVHCMHHAMHHQQTIAGASRREGPGPGPLPAPMAHLASAGPSDHRRPAATAGMARGATLAHPLEMTAGARLSTAGGDATRTVRQVLF